jgi:hypothetical protein
MRRPAFLLLLPLLLAACAGTTLPVVGSACPHPGAKPMLVAELAFGRNVKGGPGVSDADWAQFQQETLTRQFPDGLTVHEAEGQWHDPRAKRLVREPTKWVTLILPDTAESIAGIRAVTDAYKRRFGQDSVMVITHPRCVAF